ncbi:MAG TPA: hypothetical protein ENI87_09855 [bacterium]|nr:hypothetical protein [bacterium]
MHLSVKGGCDENATAERVRELFKSRIEVAPNQIEFLGLEPMLRKIGMETEMKEKRFLDARPKA